MSFNNFVADEKRNVFNQIVREEMSLDELIHPEEVTEYADSWEDIDDIDLEQEVTTALSVANNERHQGKRKQLAIAFWKKSLTRVPMEDITFETKIEAVENGYWPYQMNYDRLDEILWDLDEDKIPAECYRMAREFMDSVMYQTLHPRIEPDIERVL